MGWRVTILSGLDDRAVGILLGLNRLHEFEQTEPEFPELICVVFPNEASQLKTIPLSLDEAAIERCAQGHWQGKPRRLSHDNPIPWEIIDEVTKASWKHSEDQILLALPPSSKPHNKPRTKDREEISAYQIIHQRRSAVSFDGITSIAANQFFTMLERVFPEPKLPISQRPIPWDSIAWEPTIHLALFVHRVEGLLPGMYMFLRNSHIKKAFQSSMHEQFIWTIPENCSANFPLYLLEDGNTENLATQVSCGQEIAGQSAFSLGMIAEFDASLEKHGPWFYKRLFWEAGLVGQVLYLEAEAAGIRSTGIGCFFDDPVHRLLGWYPNTQFQSLYHFTVGGPIEDHRLTTLPPYTDHVT